MSRAEVEHEMVASRFGEALLNHVELLRDFPRLGVPLQGGHRRLFHYPFHIYYKVDEDSKQIQVKHIWHSSRRPPKAFSRR